MTRLEYGLIVPQIDDEQTQNICLLVFLFPNNCAYQHVKSKIFICSVVHQTNKLGPLPPQFRFANFLKCDNLKDTKLKKKSLWYLQAKLNDTF